LQPHPSLTLNNSHSHGILTKKSLTYRVTERNSWKEQINLFGLPRFQIMVVTLYQFHLLYVGYHSGSLPRSTEWLHHFVVSSYQNCRTFARRASSNCRHVTCTTRSLRVCTCQPLSKLLRTSSSIQSGIICPVGTS